MISSFSSAWRCPQGSGHTHRTVRTAFCAVACPHRVSHIMVGERFGASRNVVLPRFFLAHRLGRPLERSKIAWGCLWVRLGCARGQNKISNSYSQFGLRGRAPRGVTGELSPASVYVSLLPVVEACVVVAVPGRVGEVRVAADEPEAVDLDPGVLARRLDAPATVKAVLEQGGRVVCEVASSIRSEWRSRPR